MPVFPRDGHDGFRVVRDGVYGKAFLAGLPGKPAAFVCDRDCAINGGVQKHKDKGRSAVPTHLCEPQLWTDAKEALAGDRITRCGEPLLGLLRAAFTDLAGWDAFATAVNATPTAAPEAGLRASRRAREASGA